MPVIPRLFSLWRNLTRKARVEKELDQEVRSYVDLLTEEKIKSGMSAEEARRAVMIEVGGIEQVKEQVRDSRIGAWLETLLQDLRFGLRQLRRNPGFTAVAIITLALGIGANTAVFSALDAVLLRPLPFRSANRLVRVFSVQNGNQIGPSALDARDFALRNRTFDYLAVYDQWPKNVTTSRVGENPQQVVVGLASADLFRALGIHPILGRLFSAEENQSPHSHVALITEAYWSRHFSRDPHILGQTLTINNEPETIVGILPDIIPGWFDGAQSRIEIWQPFVLIPGVWDERSRGGRNYQTVGLLKPGVTIEQAQADLETIASNLAATYPVDRGLGVVVQPLINSRSTNLKPQLFLLMGAVTLILLIACSNLASLVLARNAGRQREFALRTALGASPMRMMRQVLVEALLLSLFGGVCGVGIAWLIDTSLRLRHPSRIPQLAGLTVDWRVLLFSFTISVGSIAVFGLAPAIFNTRANSAHALNEGSRSSSGRSFQSVRKGLVAVQIALSLMLMVGAGLLIQTVRHLQHQDLGFRADHLLKANFYLPPIRYSSPEAITRLCDRYFRLLRSVPGVESVSITTIYPPWENWRIMFHIDGRPVSQLKDIPSTLFGVTDAYYLRTAGIPLIRGRDFSTSDTDTSPQVAIVNEALVKRYFPNENAVGRRIELGAPPNLEAQDVWMGRHNTQVTIVGVMGDAKDRGLGIPVEPQLITLFRQMPRVNIGAKAALVRTRIPVETFEETARQLMYRLDPQVPLYGTESMAEYVGEKASDKRFTSLILTCFASLGLILAVIGLYGVISYLVVQRTHEIGVRVALGAQKSDVLHLVIGQGMTLAFAGVGIGVAGAFGLSRFLASLLYGVKPTDLLTFIAASALLAVVALLACYIPARRATKIDPMVALRHE